METMAQTLRKIWRSVLMWVRKIMMKDFDVPEIK